MTVNTCNQVNTGRSPDVGLMLGQRRRLWAIINPILVQHIVIAGICFSLKLFQSSVLRRLLIQIIERIYFFTFFIN